MTRTPFRDTAKEINRTKDYLDMSVACDRARSHGWWRNLVEHGAWAGPGGRVGPPTPESLPGIAKLFGTSVEQVSAMIAADWYDVQPDNAPSARTLRLSAGLDDLDDAAAALVEQLVMQLAVVQHAVRPGTRV
jgi:hypothetical protein